MMLEQALLARISHSATNNGTTRVRALTEIIIVAAIITVRGTVTMPCAALHRDMAPTEPGSNTNQP